MVRSNTERWIGPALMGVCVLLYVPFAGNYGLWDPWETHYGEVARQMSERHDYISLHYPCSPIEGRMFWSKPVLTFWLMAPFLRLFGLQGAQARAGELVDSWRVEWALRAPSLLLALAGIWAVFVLLRRIAGARAGLLGALVLATSPSWILVARQAMTDMPFVVPMTAALVLAGIALLPALDHEDDGVLPRRSLGRFSWPHAPAFYALVSLVGLSAGLQLAVISVQLRGVFVLGGHRLSVAGAVIMAPYWAGLAIGIWWCARARTRRSLYLLSAWVCCGLATLAKGPAGLALPALVLVLFLVVSGRWRAIVFELELPRGLLLYILVAFPWYHAMLVRHGMPFWRELIGDNYVHRATGRHGDRGTFEYYLQWIAYGMFPWSGLVALGVLRGFRAKDDGDPRSRLTRYALCWLIVDYVVLTLVRTKFHHYLLPMLPALAILAGLVLDAICTRVAHARFELLLIALPITVLCGTDLAMLPQRTLWLFNYDYVNAPGIGRPWPLPSIYGARYEYGAVIACYAVAAALAVVALLLQRRTQARHAPATIDPRPFLAGFAMLLLIAIAVGPSTRGAAPALASWRWWIPLCAVTLGGWVVARLLAIRIAPRLLLLVALGWSTFIVDRLLVDVSPHCPLCQRDVRHRPA